MIIFKPENQTQTIVVIPRYNAELVDINLRNESKATSEVFADVSTSYANGYMTLSITKNVLEAESYELQITSSETQDVLFRGKAFATDVVDLQNYKITV
tara:strand:+ start:2516 stop:2812 length:297 start_codon:yes stop_codon:yes gene_type:complete